MNITLEQMQEVARYLYQLLDDIDTATDMAQSNDAAYRKIVEGIQDKRWKVVESCDGYNPVVFKPVL